MHDRYRAAFVALGAAALSLTLGALPGVAYAAGEEHGARAGETSLSREGYWPLEVAPGGLLPTWSPRACR
jgi:hypothetical protein